MGPREGVQCATWALVTGTCAPSPWPLPHAAAETPVAGLLATAPPLPLLLLAPFARHSDMEVPPSPTALGCHASMVCNKRTTAPRRPSISQLGHVLMHLC